MAQQYLVSLKFLLNILWSDVLMSKLFYKVIALASPVKFEKKLFDF